MALPASTLRTEGDSSFPVREVASGIDALYLSGSTDLSTRLFADLAALRTAAQEADQPQPLMLGGEEFQVEPAPFGKYRYRLRHPWGLVGVTESKRLPALRVQPFAEFLHAVGPSEALRFFGGVGEYLAAGPVHWGLSRLDLFCDVQGWALAGDDRHRFVCQSRRRDLHEEGQALTGFEFGRRSTKTICARIYDKTLQVQLKGLDWWYEIWGDRFDPERQVLRVEFEIGREGLTSFAIDTPDDGLRLASAVWASVCGDWLSYKTPTSDQTPSRWPEATEWATIRGASVAGDAVGLARIRAGKRQGNLRVLTAALVGYLASVGAVLDLTDADSTLGAVRRLVADDEIRRGIPFPRRIADRAAALGSL